MATAQRPRPHLTAVRRDEERVTALELFFDLVFVVAITECTSLMAGNPTWGGLLRGVLVLGVLWWSWVGYAWLTSTVNPEEGSVRLVMFAAMAAVLVAALSVPQAFDDTALLFACAYAVVRIAHIGLYLVASRGDGDLRRSVTGLAASTAVGVSLLAAASAADGALQVGLWALALVLDAGGPLFFGVEGWRLVPGHFAERHGLVVLIAIGESIVALSVGAEHGVDAGVVAAAVVGIVVAAALWWLYFDVVALVATRHLAEAPEGRRRNAMARDSYSYLHYPMVAGIVLLALGVKTTLAEVGDALTAPIATALLGGGALYLLAHLAFRLRNVGTLNRPRSVGVVVLLALIPAATHVPALASLSLLAAVLASIIAWEAVRYAEARDRVRHQLARAPMPE
ncbi:MAG TPA: low temperature requirement protein A [Baekduia sp.]|nr:low temperature requirement protein A [Baekduia sp.]